MSTKLSDLRVVVKQFVGRGRKPLRLRPATIADLVAGLGEEVVAEATIHAGFKMCVNVPGPGTYMVIRKPIPESPEVST